MADYVPAHVITGAEIVSDDGYVQVIYRDKCPHCGRVQSEKHSGVVMEGVAQMDNGYCNSCNKLFEVKIAR